MTQWQTATRTVACYGVVLITRHNAAILLAHCYHTGMGDAGLWYTAPRMAARSAYNSMLALLYSMRTNYLALSLLLLVVVVGGRDGSACFGKLRQLLQCVVHLKIVRLPHFLLAQRAGRHPSRAFGTFVA